MQLRVKTGETFRFSLLKCKHSPVSNDVKAYKQLLSSPRLWRAPSTIRQQGHSSERCPSYERDTRFLLLERSHH
jgi:hypothetical protein